MPENATENKKYAIAGISAANTTTTAAASTELTSQTPDMPPHTKTSAAQFADVPIYAIPLTATRTPNHAVSPSTLRP